MALAERLCLDPITEDSTRSPLELSWEDDVGGIRLMDMSFPPPERAARWASSADTEGELLSGTRYQNRQVTVAIRVREPSDAAATNLVANPSLEIDTSGWNVVGTLSSSTISRILTWTRRGDYGGRVQMVNNTGSNRNPYLQSQNGASGSAVVVGTTYTAQLRVNLNALAGATNIFPRIVWYTAGGALVTTTDGTGITALGEQTITVSGAAPATAAFAAVGFGVTNLPSGGGTFDAYFDAAQLVAESSASAYFDGDTPGCSWTGTHHASTSTRSATGGARLAAILADLEEKVDRMVRDAGMSGSGGVGGTLLRKSRDTGTMVFDVCDASISDTDSKNAFLANRRAELTLTFTCKPFWREGVANEHTASDHVETTLPVLIATDSISKSAVPPLGRLQIDEDQGQDQWTLLWGMQSRYYSASADAALFYEAEGRTVQGGAATSTALDSTASGASPKAVLQGNLTTSYQSMLSTQATGGGNHLSHVGSFRVFARIQRPTANTGAVTVAWQWGEGDFRKFTTNDGVAFAADDREGVWTWTDLGLVHLSKVVAGTQRWEGRLLGKSTVAGDDLYCDCLAFFPVDEGYGEVKITPQADTVTSYSAHDEFDQTAGNLTGGRTTNAISAITAANPGVITVTAHGLSNGDTVWIEGINGTMSTVLTGFFTVAGVTANTFNVGVNTTGLVYGSSGLVSKPGGKALPVGGTWYVAGANTAGSDFAVETSGHTAQRTAVSDSIALIALPSGPAALTTTAAQTDLKFSISSAGSTDNWGVVARYVDSANHLRAKVYPSSSNYLAVVVEKMVNASPTTIAATTTYLGTLASLWITLRLVVTSTGYFAAYAIPQGGSIGSPVISGSDSALATGGALVSGRAGLYDMSAVATAVTRNYDNFQVWVPPVDAAVFASHSAEIRSDRVVRQDSGGTIWTPPSSYKGSYMQLPTGGREDRTVRWIAKLSRNNIDTAADSAIDDLSGQLRYQRRGLVVAEQ
jgi:hypothetical protein